LTQKLQTIPNLTQKEKVVLYKDNPGNRFKRKFETGIM